MQLGSTLTTLPYDIGADFRSTGNALQSSGPHRQEAARDIRISLRRDIRRELNAQLRMVKGEQLNRFLAGYFDRGKQKLEMQLQDGPSSDRHAWAAASGEHGREVYRDDNNNVDIQLQRLARLQHLAQREIEAGCQPPAVKFHDFLNALAGAKLCKQPGSDGVVVEMVRALSWSTLLWLYLFFLVRLHGLRDLMLGVR